MNTDALLMGGVVVLIASPFIWKAAIHYLRTRSTCGSKAHPGGTMDADAWFIGPRLKGFSGDRGGNQSRGMPAHPTRLFTSSPAPAGGRSMTQGWSVDFPVGKALPLGTGDKLDYITFRHGPLTGKRSIKLRYRLDLAPGAEVLAVPQQDPNGHYRARITPYFQREGDDWTTNGKYETYRWYYTLAEMIYLEAGEHELVIPLDTGWGATQFSTIDSAPDKFRAAIDHACCVGFVFGGNELGVGHGARATGKATFTLLACEVE